MTAATRGGGSHGLCAVAIFALASEVSGQDCLWDERPVPGPEFRAGARMVFDQQREVVVLFGGGQRGPLWPGNTWEWDGAAWTEAAPAGSGPGGGGRIYHGFVYDTSRDATLLFGGVGPSGQFNNDLWSWDGSAWTDETPAGTLPPARNGAAMAFDSARGVVVLFGGLVEGSVRVGDTWEYDGTSWTLKSSGGPAPRLYSAMVYDEAREVTVLFGGNTPTYLSDTWEWDGETWTERPVVGPPGRAAQGMTYDAQRGVVLVFGGLAAGGITYDDTWQWDGSAWTLLDVAGPSPRYNAPIQFDAARANTILFGGLLAGPTWGTDTWILGCDSGCYADCDESGSLDFFDFLCFQNEFAAGAPEADCDGSGGLDFFDFLCFQNEFAAGCP